MRRFTTAILLSGVVTCALSDPIHKGVEVPSSTVDFAPEVGLNAKSAILIDERSGVVLFEKDADALRYPASTTKILTALLLLEVVPLNSMITAPASAKSVEGASLHLKPGEKISAKDLLYGILLRSANDGCHTLAVHVAGDDAEFAKLMNDRARRIGCTNTQFTAPHGLHNDLHYTTARDLAMIAREAMQNEMFRSIVGQRRAVISRSINLKDTLLISKNEFLDLDKSYDGIKTGYTKMAGSTFVGSASRNGYRFISVILNSPDWKADQKALMNWGFQNFTRSVAYSKMAPITTMRVPQSPGEIKVGTDADVHYAHRIEQPPQIQSRVILDEGVGAPITEGQILGKIELTDGRGWVKTVPAIALESAEKAVIPDVAGPNGWTLAAGGGLLGLTFLVRAKSRRMARGYSTP